jgi:hypothetical protein
MYEPGALKFLPGRDSIPLLVSHDADREIGRLNMLYRMDWTDGPWFVAAGTVTTDPPPWLKHGTRASFGFGSLHCRDVVIRERRAEVVARGILNEVSVLEPGTTPAEPLAEVLRFRPTDVPKEIAGGAGYLRSPTRRRGQPRQRQAHPAQLRRRNGGHHGRRQPPRIRALMPAGYRNALRDIPPHAPFHGRTVVDYIGLSDDVVTGSRRISTEPHVSVSGCRSELHRLPRLGARGGRRTRLRGDPPSGARPEPAGRLRSDGLAERVRGSLQPFTDLCQFSRGKVDALLLDFAARLLTVRLLAKRRELPPHLLDSLGEVS